MTVQKLDTAVYYCLLLYALASSISIAAANIGISFALLFAIIRHFKQSVIFDIDARLVKVILIFWAVIFLSAIFAYKQPLAFSKWWAYVYRGLPFFLAALFIDSRRKLFTVLSVMAASLFIADMAGIWQAFKGHRSVGLSSMTMIMAGYLLQMIPVLLVLSLEEKGLSGKRKLIVASVALISFVVLGLNGTRGAWLGVLVALLVYALLRLRDKTKAAVVVLLAMMVIVGIGANIEMISNRALTVLDTSGKSYTERVLLWDGAWRMFLDHPLVGVGPGSFEETYLSRYISPQAQLKLGHAHNNFFHILAENGLLGLLSFLAMFGYFLYYLFKQGTEYNNKVALGVFLATISLLLQGLTEFNFGDSAVIRMFWFLLGLAAAYAKIDADSSPG